MQLFQLVLLFNLAAIPLWLLLQGVQRAHRSQLVHLKARLEFLREEGASNLEGVENLVREAEARGPLGGRSARLAAVLALASLEPEFADDEEPEAR